MSNPPKDIEEKLTKLVEANPRVEGKILGKRLQHVVGENASVKVKRSKIIAIVKEVELALAPFVACAPKCSHCCYRARPIYRHEAQALAQASGRTVARVSGRNMDGNRYVEERYAGKPCPFLVDDLCSVYDHRPFTCRTQHSLNEDANDCALVDSDTVQVNSFATDFLEYPYMVITERHDASEPWDDIREFFPT